MVIEKFITYKYDNVFYTKEELEEMGFTYMKDKEDYKSLKVDSINYEIIRKSSISESIHCIEELLKLDEERLAGQFFYNFGDHGLILDVEKYYGIKYKYQGKVKMIKLFNDESKCSTAYYKIDTQITKTFESLDNINYKENNEVLIQEQAKETKQKILSFINEK